MYAVRFRSRIKARSCSSLAVESVRSMKGRRVKLDVWKNRLLIQKQE